MLNSDFNIFDVCISMVTAMIGLALPMFIERIRKIYDIYNSKVVSDKFKKEWSYKFFLVMIVICLIELFVIPLINAALNNAVYSHVLLTIQGISVFVFSMNMVYLYRLLLIYLEPELLLKKIRSNGIRNEQYRLRV